MFNSPSFTEWGHRRVFLTGRAGPDEIVAVQVERHGAPPAPQNKSKTLRGSRFSMVVRTKPGRRLARLSAPVPIVRARTLRRYDALRASADEATVFAARGSRKNRSVCPIGLWKSCGEVDYCKSGGFFCVCVIELRENSPV